MDYIGSKLSLLEFIENWINKIVQEETYTFSDLFAGTGVVGKHFKERWHKIIANDIQYYSYVLNRHYIKNNNILLFKWLENTIEKIKKVKESQRKNIVIKYLNNLEWKKWFIYNHYCEWGTQNKKYQRLYFSDKNGLKGDAIRQKIEDWKEKEMINENEYFYLLTCLLEAIDKVSNTACVYWAFLKKLKKVALKDMILTPIKIYKNQHQNEVYKQDINDLIKKTSHDVVYLDPPYNNRQYSSNYHVLETIAKYDNPKIKGKTWQRNNKKKSQYCRKRKVKETFRDLIENIDAKYVFLSYNDEWLMNLKDIKTIMSKIGKYWVLKRWYKRFKADKDTNRDHKKKSVVEYLHYVKC